MRQACPLSRQGFRYAPNKDEINQKMTNRMTARHSHGARTNAGTRLTRTNENQSGVSNSPRLRGCAKSLVFSLNLIPTKYTIFMTYQERPATVLAINNAGTPIPNEISG